MPKPNNTLGYPSTTEVPGHDLLGVVPSPGPPSGSRSDTSAVSILLTSTILSRNPYILPTGNVIFTAGGHTLGVVPLDHTGTATLTVPAGTFTIGETEVIAFYAGDANFPPASSSPLIQIITASTTTTLFPSVNPSYPGEVVVFTATVNNPAPPPNDPTGTVSFFDGDNLLGIGTVSANVATLAVNSLSLGTHMITAVYSGDDVYLSSSSSPFTQVVSALTTTTSVVSSANPSYPTESVTFTATVDNSAPPPNNPTGTVSFYNGVTLLGTRPVSANTATFTTTSLSVGTHTITATYNGDSTYSSSTSSPLSQVVSLLSTVTTVMSSANPSTQGNSVTFSSTVHNVSPPPDNPSGSVSFYDGMTLLGTGSVSSNAASYSTSSLTAGTHSITATYGGDSVYATSTSSPLSQVVNSNSQLWMLGTIGSNTNISVFIMDPVSLSINNSFSVNGSTYSTLNTPVYANGYVWVLAANSSTHHNDVLQYTPTGTLNNTITSSALPNGNAQMFFDGANTLSIVANGCIYSLNVNTLLVSTLYSPSTSPLYQSGAWDQASGTIGGSIQFNLVADSTRVATFNVTGLTNTFISTSPNSAYGGTKTVNADGYFWIWSYNGYPGGPTSTAFQFIQINPSTSTFDGVISPPGTSPIIQAPSPYFTGLGIDMCYNSSKDLIYASYPAITSGSPPNARIDAINPTTGAISTVISTLPSNFGESAFANIATNGNSIWITDCKSTVSLVNINTQTVTNSVTLPAGDFVGTEPGALVYIP